MAYTLQAIVADAAILDGSKAGVSGPVPLAQGKAMLLFTRAARDAMASTCCR
jgi:hypothetical protein